MFTSYSETSTYLTCKRRHHYGYVENLTRISESEALVDGKIGHAVLQSYYENVMLGMSHEGAVAVAYGKFKESGYVWDPDGKRANLEEMLFGYYFPNEPYVRNGWTVLAVEREMTLTWETDPNDTYGDSDDGYKFIIDLILRDPQGAIVVVDHKFTGMFTTEDSAQLLPQIPLYIAGIRGQNLPADRGEYNEINMRKVQKKRSVADALHKTSVIPSGARVVETFRQQVEVAKEINERKKLSVAESSASAWRVSNKIICQGCPFVSICVGELSGANTALIRRTDYTQRTRKVFEGEIRA